MAARSRSPWLPGWPASGSARLRRPRRCAAAPGRSLLYPSSTHAPGRPRSSTRSPGDHRAGLDIGGSRPLSSRYGAAEARPGRQPGPGDWRRGCRRGSGPQEARRRTQTADRGGHHSRKRDVHRVSRPNLSLIRARSTAPGVRLADGADLSIRRSVESTPA